LAQFHGTTFGIFGFFFTPFFFRLPTFSGPSTTDETLLVEMRIWCIKIGIVLALHICTLGRDLSFGIKTFDLEL
jgi:hypothetical protein